MGHQRHNQRFNWLSYLALLVLVMSSFQIHAQDDSTAASVAVEEGSSSLPSKAPAQQIIEFRPEDDPNMIDSEGGEPDTNTSAPLPTNLQEIISVHQRVGKILDMSRNPVRLPSSNGSR